MAAGHARHELGDLPAALREFSDLASFLTEADRELDAVEPLATASLNGGDLARLGLQPGDPVTVASRRGSVTLRTRRDDGTPAGAVFIPFAYAEAAANLLTNAALDPTAKIPEFKYCAVRLSAGGALAASAGYGGGTVAA